MPKVKPKFDPVTKRLIWYLFEELNPVKRQQLEVHQKEIVEQHVLNHSNDNYINPEALVSGPD